MISQREVKRKYSLMLKRQAGETPSGTNCYTCSSCDTITKTVDRDAGTTPFIIGCPSCNGIAKSAFYSDLQPEKAPTHQFIRPTLEKALKMRKKGKEGLLGHVLSGGLVLEPLKI